MILEGLEWLGVTPDQPPVFQSTRVARHAEVARQMLASGHAYQLLLHGRRTAADARAGASPRVGRRATTGAGVIAIRPKHRPELRPPSG